MRTESFRRSFRQTCRAAIGAAALVLAATTASAFNIVGDANSHRFSNGEKTVLSFTQSGSLTVTGSGTIELLVVGGGGGGGELGSVSDNQGIKVAGGGGAGGLVHKASFSVSAGTYAVTVGAGGAIGVNGGNSSVFSVTGYGGGFGARGGSGERTGGSGGSGGGSNCGWTTVVAGGPAIYGDEDNLGHDGSKAENRFCQGGGGGAGSSPTKKVKRNSYDTVLDIDDSSDGIAYGGDGLAFDITGSMVYYAGGGAAYNSYGCMRSMGGKGGGGHGNQAGVDGLGGGGGGGAKGGSGCVIMSFIPDEAQPENSLDFALSGGTVLATTNGIAHKFTTSGTLTVTGSGTVELLVVGGGGGGGALGTHSGANLAAGGGAGGLVYAASVPVTAGSYAITVGAGGAVGAKGGNSSALGFVAYGGGFGAQGMKAQCGGYGGSGGGSATGWEDVLVEGRAAYPAWGNQGHDGSRHGGFFNCGGGGGAGGSPAWQVQQNTSTVLALDPYDKASVVGPAYGGDGLAFDITGVSTYYAGGGAAYLSGSTGTALGGKGGGGNGNQAGTNGLGGGGGGGAAGGSGVVIVRYMPADRITTAISAEGGTITSKDGYHIHTFTADGTFTLPQAVLCDVLVVGGGGGGGELGSVTDNQGIKVAGGGGAGGLIYYESLPIPAGNHSITVGAGGAIGANGGNSSLLGITAYGGGYGAKGGTGERTGGDGASGGGANTGWTTIVAGGSAIYGDANNLGHDGSKAESRFCCGGGGGAGGSPAKKVKRDSWGEIILDIDDASDGVPYGGDGLACDITGESVYYAGGGAAYNSWGVGTIPGGKGGGGNGNQAGTNGLGGGGGGGKAGGSGVVIIRYRYEPGTVLTFK